MVELTFCSWFSQKNLLGITAFSCLVLDKYILDSKNLEAFVVYPTIY